MEKKIIDSGLTILYNRATITKREGVYKKIFGVSYDAKLFTSYLTASHSRIHIANEYGSIV